VAKKQPSAQDLPIGFSMALAQNGPAMTAFAGMEQTAREEIIARARQARSRADMRQIVSSIAEDTKTL